MFHFFQMSFKKSTPIPIPPTPILTVPDIPMITIPNNLEEETSNLPEDEHYQYKNTLYALTELIKEKQTVNRELDLIQIAKLYRNIISYTELLPTLLNDILIPQYYVSPTTATEITSKIKLIEATLFLVESAMVNIVAKSNNILINEQTKNDQPPPAKEKVDFIINK
jgi:hypothetical protein